MLCRLGHRLQEQLAPDPFLELLRQKIRPDRARFQQQILRPVGSIPLQATHLLSDGPLKQVGAFLQLHG